jgi:hypothetical protein
MEEVKSAFKVLTGKHTGKRPLGRPRRRWEDNIRLGLESINQSINQVKKLRMHLNLLN